MLNPSVFSHHPASTFFKLFVSSDIAVREAMKQRTLQSVKAAVKPTIWFILKLRLTHKAVAQLFMRREAPCIEHGPPEGKGFRFFGELDISELAKEWDETENAALGIDGWKVYALALCVSKPDGQCAECKIPYEEVFTSKSKSKNPCTEWYCASCWHSYMLKQFDDTEPEDGSQEFFAS